MGSTSLEDVFLKINNKAITDDTKYIKRNITYKSKELATIYLEVPIDKDFNKMRKNAGR